MRTQAAAALEARIFTPDATLHAPHLLDVEVTQVLRRYTAAKLVTASRATQALQDYQDLSIARYPHVPFLDRVFALRNQLTAYDAVYVALAEALDASLLTCDGHLARAHGHRARVDFLPGSAET